MSDSIIKKMPSIDLNVRHWFDKIESIKSTMTMANGDRPELWIQRQNLQDLYRLIILNDIDFTIDKKLEQDLWNYVFKIQINYFQTQIKKESTSATSSSTASGSSANSSSSFSMKKLEAQANYSYFLEAARGFYTKLLEDIISNYNLNDSGDNNVPFCQSFPSLFDKIKSLGNMKIENDQNTKNGLSKEKQIFYICQHILTHLGDIARYANQFQQAKNYYYHAIKMVPYLGHPYNQLGILFETSRTNQLATVFYYIRSIAVKYTFPLASNNLENFFYKLIEIPLNRYNQSQLANNLVKLSHKDLLTLFLQINAVIYFAKMNKHQRLINNFKLNSYIDLFKPAFELFMNTNIQRDKLDAIQLCQVIVIMIFVLSIKSTNQNINETAIDLFTFMIQQFINLYQDSADLILSSLYISFNFIEHFDIDCVNINKFWPTWKSCHSTIEMLNELSEIKLNLDDLEDYPLNEDRMLDSFLPLEKSMCKYSMKKYVRNLNLFNESDENNLRKCRIVSCLKRVLNKNQFSDDCFIVLNNEKFTINSLKCPVRIEHDSTSPQAKEDSTASPNQLQQLQRKKRQNVALTSITKSNNLLSETSPSKQPINSTNKIPSTSSSSSPSPLTISSSSNSSSNSNSHDRTISNIKTVNFQANNKNIHTNQTFFPSASTSLRQFNQSSFSSLNQNNDSLNNRNSIDNKNVFPSFLPSIDPIKMNSQNLFSQKNNQQNRLNSDNYNNAVLNSNDSSSLWSSLNVDNFENITSNLTNLNTLNNQLLWPSLVQEQQDQQQNPDINLAHSLQINDNINDLLIQQLLLNNNTQEQYNPSKNDNKYNNSFW